MAGNSYQPDLATIPAPAGLGSISCRAEFLRGMKKRGD